MNKLLTYTEYQKKMRETKTPEEVSAFIKELTTSMLADIDTKIDEDKEKTETIISTQNKQITLPREKMYAARQADVPEINMLLPWYDVTNNETETRIISLYAKGLTTRDIASYMKTMHSIEISQQSISAITDKVFPLIKDWQTRPLSVCYPIVYLDGLHFKVRDAGKITSKVAYVALGISQYGQKEVLGIWISESEGAKFWMQVLNDLKNRGVNDILIACVDGLKGFPEGIKAIFPHTDVQVCITHQIRHTIMFISHKDRKQFCDELKSVYIAPNENAGMEALKDMQERWPRYSSYLKSWEMRWSDLAPFFGYPEPVRRIVYTTNTIENLNRQFRKVTKTTTIFPHDDALMKLLWLAQADITHNWMRTTRNWGEIMAQLNIMFPDRIFF